MSTLIFRAPMSGLSHNNCEVTILFECERQDSHAQRVFRVRRVADGGEFYAGANELRVFKDLEDAL